MSIPFLVLALLTPSLAGFAAAGLADAACSVPCGRIYPTITVKIPDQAAVYDFTRSTPLVLEADVTYSFDVAADGYSPIRPDEPIVIGFEFPRKPKWADIVVEPDRLSVDVNNPTFVSAAGPEEVRYSWTQRVTITSSLTGQAILRDGFDYGKLLVFAKSTESGMYQSGYGIKEIRVAPEGAVHESDVNDASAAFTPQALPRLDLAPAEREVGGVKVRVEPPSSGSFWTPQPFTVRVDPPPEGRMVFAVHDEAGELVMQGGPRAATAKSVWNVTLARPGLHTASVTLLPEDGLPLTIPIDFAAGDASAEGYTYPKEYLASVTEPIPAPGLILADARGQFERDFPFYALDSAQSTTVSLGLVAPVAGLPVVGANLEFALIDPEGKELAKGSVDPSVPLKELRVGTMPTDGWYLVRVRGLGAPDAAAYTVGVRVAYQSEPSRRNAADSLEDDRGGVVSHAGANLSLGASALALWSPGTMEPAWDRSTDRGMRYHMTIAGEDGFVSYASGWRTGGASYAPTTPGLHRAFVYVEPVPTVSSFAPVVREISFVVPNGAPVSLRSFHFEDVFEVPRGSGERLVGLVRLPAGEGSLQISGAGRSEEVGDLVLLYAKASPTEPTSANVDLAYDLASAIEVPPLRAQADPRADTPFPSLGAILAVLALAGLVAQRRH